MVDQGVCSVLLPNLHAGLTGEGRWASRADFTFKFPRTGGTRTLAGKPGVNILFILSIELDQHPPLTLRVAKPSSEEWHKGQTSFLLTPKSCLRLYWVPYYPRRSTQPICTKLWASKERYGWTKLRSFPPNIPINSLQNLQNLKLNFHWQISNTFHESVDSRAN